MKLMTKSMMTLSLLLITSSSISSTTFAQTSEVIGIHQLKESNKVYEDNYLKISAKFNKNEKIEHVTFNRLNRISEISEILPFIPEYLEKVDFEFVTVDLKDQSDKALKNIQYDLTILTSITRGQVVKVYDLENIEENKTKPKELKFKVENQNLFIETTSSQKIAIVYEETLESSIQAETTVANLTHSGIQAVLNLSSNRTEEVNRVIETSELPDISNIPTINIPTQPERPTLPVEPKEEEQTENTGNTENTENPIQPEIPVVPIIPEEPVIPVTPIQPEMPSSIEYRYVFSSQEEAEKYASELMKQYSEIQSYAVKKVEGKGYTIEYVTEPKDFNLSKIETSLSSLENVNEFLKENKDSNYQIHKAADSKGNDVYLLVKDIPKPSEETVTPDQPESPETSEETTTPSQSESPETSEETETPNQAESPEASDEIVETPSQSETPEVSEETEESSQPETSTLPEGMSESLRSQHESFLENGYTYSGTDSDGSHTYTKSFE